MPLDLTGLTALLAVAEKRSFTAAAAELRVTPSAVSQTVRAFEERVGVQLLHRTTRSVSLTEAGARFVEQLRAWSATHPPSGPVVRNAEELRQLMAREERERAEQSAFALNDKPPRKKR